MKKPKFKFYTPHLSFTRDLYESELYIHLPTEFCFFKSDKNWAIALRVLGFGIAYNSNPGDVIK